MTEKKYRLSKLQKWILIQATKDSYLYNDDVYKKYFGLKLLTGEYWGKRTGIPKMIVVSLSRSKELLREQGYVKEPYWCRTKEIELTDKGKEKAKELEAKSITKTAGT